MLLVTKSKTPYGNVLALDNKKHEYVYLHKGKEIWREPSLDGSLANYFIKCRSNDTAPDFADMEELKEYPIYTKYCNSCLSIAY